MALGAWLSQTWKRAGRRAPAAAPPAVSEAERGQAETERLRNDIESLRTRIDGYADYAGMADESEYDIIVLRKSEELLGVFQGVSLAETRRGKTTYQGGSSGFSMRVASGIYYRVGAHRGSVIQAPEQQTVIDRGGTLVITSLRAVYVGTKYTREFLWSRLLSAQTYAWGKDRALLLLPVSNRVKLSGVSMPASGQSADIIDERVQVGLAIYHDRLDQFLNGLRSQLAEAESRLEALERVAGGDSARLC